MDAEFQRLYREALAGGDCAALVAAARRTGDPGDLALALLLEANPQGWGDVAGAIDAVDPDALPGLVERALPLIARWDPEHRYTPSWWLARLIEGAPAPQVRLCGRLSQRYTELGDDRAQRVFGRPELENVRLIDLEHSRIGPAATRVLLRSAHLTGVERLRLGRNVQVGSTAVDELVADARWGSLKHLDLEYTGLGDADVERLVASPHLAGIGHLVLNKNAIGDPGVAALVRSPLAGSLSSLELANTEVGDAGARALAGCAELRGLRCLRLDSTDVDDPGAEALAESPHLQRLEQLRLNHSDMGARGVVAILDAFPRLKVLTLDALAPGADGAWALARRAPGLEELSTWRSGMSPAEVARVAGSPAVARLRSWSLSAVAFERAEWEAFCASEHLGALRTLKLYDCSATAAGLIGSRTLRLHELDLWKVNVDDELAGLFTAESCAGLRKLRLIGQDLSRGACQAFRASRLTELQELELTSTRLEKGAVEALVSSPSVRSLERLGLTGCRAVGDATLDALAESPHLEALKVLFTSQTQCTDAGRERLRAARPSLKLY